MYKAVVTSEKGNGDNLHVQKNKAELLQNASSWFTSEKLLKGKIPSTRTIIPDRQEVELKFIYFDSHGTS